MIPLINSQIERIIIQYWYFFGGRLERSNKHFRKTKKYLRKR